MRYGSMVMSQLLFLSLIGCSFGTFPLLDRTQGSQGPRPLFDRSKFEKIDLDQLLNSASEPSLNSSQTFNYFADGKKQDFSFASDVKETQIKVYLDQALETKTYQVSFKPETKEHFIHFDSPPKAGAKVVIETLRTGVQEKERPGDSEPVDLLLSYKRFEDSFSGTVNADKNLKRMRNSIQERILAASNERCGEYKNFLRQFESEGNFFLGTLATTLGGLGAIFTPAATARALAGLAGITSGVRAEFQEDLFHKLAVYVITDGIDKRRTQIYGVILQKQREDYDSYTLMHAVNDAVVYHSSCTTLIGLQAASDSIRESQDPGLSRLREAVMSAGLKTSVVGIKLEPLTTRTTVGEKVNLKASGGGRGYHFAIMKDSTDGAKLEPLGEDQATYVTGTKPGETIVGVTDSFMNSSAVVIFVKQPLQFTSSVASIKANSKAEFEASDGFPPYSFSVRQDTTNGSSKLEIINGKKASYLAGKNPGVIDVEVRDAAGEKKQASVHVVTE